MDFSLMVISCLNYIYKYYKLIKIIVKNILKYISYCVLFYELAYFFIIPIGTKCHCDCVMFLHKYDVLFYGTDSLTNKTKWRLANVWICVWHVRKWKPSVCNTAMTTNGKQINTIHSQCPVMFCFNVSFIIIFSI